MDTQDEFDSGQLEQESFLTRLTSIPLIQDSLTGAHQMAQCYPGGQKVLDYAHHMLSLSQPYLSSHDHQLLVRANDLGNKSLELIERQFPMIHQPTDELVGYIQISIFQKNRPDHLQGMDRLMKRVNDVSLSVSNTTAYQLSATVDQERQIKHMIQKQVHSESFKAIFGSAVQTMYNLTQTEFDKFHQELLKPNMSHMERIRNILVLSQTDILMPLYQKSVSSL
ncbi:hypothetical protein CU098_013637 [Rhizopus stolonifer]|uniref:Uncharacterized protein n=1 Tax=Rhizopus stolonifer TaxID=4846 RepID=A0A367KXU9_RHIST|nr:hypothetical protein CU098_013637 [Rhizopus stolonifer]